MYHTLILAGRLGRDPEMRYTPDGTPVTSFSVAVDQGFGESKTTLWFRVSAWRKLAEVCNQYLSKGRQVLVEGYLRAPKPYQGRDNEWRASLDVTATQVRFLGSRADTVNGSEPAESTDQETPAGDLGEEEIPF